MELKQNVYLRKDFLSFSFTCEPASLPVDVLETCKILKKDVYLFEVFVGDQMNGMLLSNARFICQKRNFCYYLSHNADFLQTINFAGQRHLCIFTVLEHQKYQIDSLHLKRNFAFSICFENYLDTCELLVRRKSYTNEIEQLLRESCHPE